MTQATSRQSNSTDAIVVFDIDGVVRDVAGSYRRAIADTVEHFTGGADRPTQTDMDKLKSEGIWNNDWEASQELVYRYFEEQGQQRHQVALDYQILIDFFQSRYQGPDSQNWTGYICDEALLLQPSYLENLTAAGIPWGFFSGAPRAEAAYVLSGRLGLNSPVLIAMEDAPGKPDPTGLLAAVHQLENQSSINAATPVIYVGDTVADMLTAEKARLVQPTRRWIGVGILPPHLQHTPDRLDAYTANLKQAGAIVIFNNVQELTPARIRELLQTSL
ncbi:TIGR01548 family HAD-type hydrolase [Aerosakkonema sp. BLCC-F183]|uniref:TIGR01548 family HAD-type hydrolase n=1 Tax=Aerosakkonema sp. BLCC-F183 TaxID=3342834 RepID=UPI0035B731B6